MHFFYTPWKYKEIYGFLMISACAENRCIGGNKWVKQQVFRKNDHLANNHRRRSSQLVRLRGVLRYVLYI